MVSQELIMSAPVLGLVAGGFGLGAVFLASALVVTCSAAVAVRLLSAPRRARKWA